MDQGHTMSNQMVGQRRRDANEKKSSVVMAAFMSSAADSGIVQQTSQENCFISDEEGNSYYAFPARPARPWYENLFWPFRRKVLMLRGLPFLENDPEVKIKYTNSFAAASVYKGIPPKRIRLSKRMWIIGCPADDYTLRVLCARSLLGLTHAVQFLPSENWAPSVLSSYLNINLYVPSIASGGWKVPAVPEEVYANTYAVEVLHERLMSTGSFDLWELYAAQNENQSGRCSLPILWDRGSNYDSETYEEAQIITNNSLNIMRILNKQLRGLSDCIDVCPNLRPRDVVPIIDGTNEMVMALVKSVALSSFIYIRTSTESKDYLAWSHFVERSQVEFYNVLTQLEELLEVNLYLNGDTITESDLMLYPILYRFDSTIYMFFRLRGRGRLRKSFPNLQAYLQRLYANPKIQVVSPKQIDLAHYTVLLLRWADIHTVGNILALCELHIGNLFGALDPDSSIVARYTSTVVSTPFWVLRSILP